MTHEPTTTTLALDDDRHQCLHGREWTAEHWGMAFVALVVAAALAGLLGPGPLSYRTEISSDGQLSVEHYALQRYDAPVELVIHFRTSSPDTTLIVLGLSRTFTDCITVEGMTPEPESTEMEADRLVYSFRASHLGDGGKIIVRYRNGEFGPVSYTVDVGEGAQTQVSHFVFP